MQMSGHAHEDVLHMRGQMAHQDRIEIYQRERDMKAEWALGLGGDRSYAGVLMNARHLWALAVIPREELPCLVCDQYQVHSREQIHRVQYNYGLSTFAPVAPRARAMDRPMPLEDPVTMQTGLSTAREGSVSVS